MYVSLHNCMRQNTPFYMFNIEHVTQIKQGPMECFGSLFGKYDVTFRRFSIKVVAMWDATKACFKTTVALFLGKKYNISLFQIDFNK